MDDPAAPGPGPGAGPHLRRTAENADEIEALAAAWGGRVGLAGVLGDLDQQARRTWAPGRAVRRALTWEAADRRDPVWWPQGVSSSAEAAAADLSPGDGVTGREVLVVSWYAKGEQGSRLTFLDLPSRRYRHVLLAVPTYDDGVAGWKPLAVHAGGIVWHGPYLHVAATGRGFHTCRLDDLLRVPPGPDDSATHGHRYVLPVRFSYRAAADEGHERLRYSFLSLDRSTDPPHLLAGEYGAPRQTRRLARFPLDRRTALLAAAEDRVLRPVRVDGGVVRMQGVAVVDGRHYLTRSHGPWTLGSVYVGRPGAFRRRRWATPMGPEDLTWWPEQDLLWTVSEHPRRRWVVGLSRSWLDR